MTDIIYTINLGHRVIVMSNEKFDALWPLGRDYAPVDPLKGRWHQMTDDVTRLRTILWSDGLIDERGNLTNDGKLVVKTIMEDDARFMEEAIANLEDEAALIELDELDRACRRRPRQRRYDG